MALPLMLAIILSVAAQEPPTRQQGPGIQELAEEFDEFRQEVEREHEAIHGRLGEIEIAERFYQTELTAQTAVFSTIVLVVVTLVGLISWRRVHSQIEELEGVFEEARTELERDQQAAVARLDQTERLMKRISANLFELIAEAGGGVGDWTPEQQLHFRLDGFVSAVELMAEGDDDAEDVVARRARRLQAMVDHIAVNCEAEGAKTLRGNVDSILRSIDRLAASEVEAAKDVAAHVRVVIRDLLKRFPEAQESQGDLALKAKAPSSEDVQEE